MWKPSITSNEVLMHSQGPWNKHKYVKIVDGKYYYPNSYKDGRTISDLKGERIKDKDIDKIADETIKGKHGNGQERKEKFGSDYARIQNRVNEKLGNKKRHKEDEDDDTKKEEKKEETKEEESKDKKDEKDKDSKKKGSGSSKKDKESDEEKKKKKGSKKKGSSKNGSSSKSNSLKSSKGSSSKTSYADQILKKRREEQRQREKERRRRKNIAMGREYLNHSAIWAPTPSADELYHHGIQGQKWGKKNGPPYPLDQSQKSQAERRYRTDGGHHEGQHEQKRTLRKGKLTWSPVFGLGYQRGQRNSEVMSNRELQKRISRRQLEQRYNELEDAQINRGRNQVIGYIRDYTLVAGAALTTAKLIKMASGH